MTSPTKIRIRLNVPLKGKVVVRVRAGDFGHKELEGKHQIQLK